MDGLRVEGLTKNFGGLHALENVNLEVFQGERRAIIGPNGSGKSTLFNLISGLLRPSGGRIFLFGQDISAWSPYKRAQIGLGRTFQITTLFPELSVMQNIVLGVLGHNACRFGMFRPLCSYGSISNSAEELLRNWGLWEKRETLVRNLSYGEQRRMEVLLNLASKPRIMLLDEPTAGLSSAEAKDLCDAVQTLEKDITLLIIEHDMDVVFGIADTITVLHHGRVIADGDKEAVRAAPEVKEVYLGSKG